MSKRWFDKKKNFISARQRWDEGHVIRTAIITNVFEELSLTKKEDVSKDVEPRCIKQNCKDIEKIKQSINDTMNRFSNETDHIYMFNNSIGKAAKEETAIVFT